MKRIAILACLVVFGAVAAVSAALAGASAQVHGAATKVRKLEADPNGDLKFDRRRISVRHGIVKLVMLNPSTSGLDHGIAISRKGFKKVGKTVGPGDTSTVRARLKPGKYVFYCPVPGHRAAGMRGTLTVK